MSQQLQDARTELARLERMVLAQRQKVVELERQAFDYAPRRQASPVTPFTITPLPKALQCKVTAGCWLAPGHVGHCD